MVQLPPSQVHMGHFRVVVEIGNRVGERFVTIEALVDTGATYTWVPRDVLGTLGVVPDEGWPFILADGREVRYPMGWMQIKIGGRADRKSTRLNSSHVSISYAVFCLKKKTLITLSMPAYVINSITLLHESQFLTPSRLASGLFICMIL